MTAVLIVILFLHHHLVFFFLVTTSDCYVITSNNSYGDEMSSYPKIPIRKPYWSPVIAAPNKTMTPPLPVSSCSSRPSSSSSDCWDWLLFSPQYYSEFYTPSSIYVHYQKFEEKENDDGDLNFLASLPTCLLALLYLTPKLIGTSNDENENDQEIRSLHKSDESLLSSIKKKTSSNDNQKNRSSTPDTDDGYQSASDYSQQLPIPSDHHHSHDDITINEHSLPTPLMPRRISYAAAVKPILTSTNKTSLFSTSIGKSKQISATNDLLNSNGQKMKFIAPRFERMHHAKQYASSSSLSTTSSNRTQIRSNNQQCNPIVNPTRRR